MAIPSRSYKLLIQMDLYTTKYKMKQTMYINKDACRVCGSTEGRIWEGFMKGATFELCFKGYIEFKTKGERKGKALQTNEIT